jgi:signal peptidase I
MIAGVVLPALGTIAAILVIGRLALQAVIVVGGSMEPSLNAGDVLLATRWRPRKRVKRGAIVLVRGFGGPEPNSQALRIKRVGCIAGDTAYIDSRSFGPIPVSSIVGVVLAKLGSFPPRRRIPARRGQR